MRSTIYFATIRRRSTKPFRTPSLLWRQWSHHRNTSMLRVYLENSVCTKRSTIYVTIGANGCTSPLPRCSSSSLYEGQVSLHWLLFHGETKHRVRIVGHEVYSAICGFGCARPLRKLRTAARDKFYVWLGHGRNAFRLWDDNQHRVRVPG